jgi:hypothetical protein
MKIAQNCRGSNSIMIGRKLTTLVAVATVAIPAAPSQAFFGHCCKKQPTTTFYAPVAAAPVVAPVCPQPTIVNYMPQTAFRSVIVNRPVVTMVPQPSCDACGRQTTVMRPVTTFVAQQQLVPYTTFRPVAMPVAQPCCGAAPVTVGFAPAVTSVPVAAPAAPSCCGAAATPVPTLSNFAPSTVVTPAPAPAAPCCGGASTPTPSLSGYAPAPTATIAPATTVAPSTTVTPLAPNTYTPNTYSSNAYTQSVPSGAPGSTLKSLEPTPDPTLNAAPTTPSTTPNPTFAPSTNGTTTPSTGEAQPQSRILLPPSAAAPSTTSNRPTGLDPEDGGDRTTAIPLRGYTVRQASLIVPIKAEKPVSNDGWRPAAE